jgi:hypothetical protein
LYFLNNRSWYCTSFDRGHSDHLAESPDRLRADPRVHRKLIRTKIGIVRL